MEKIKIWKINDTNCILTKEEIINNLFEKTRLLDLTKTKYSKIEKYVYDIAIYHFNKLNININSNYFVEFWIKSKFDTHKLHVDCDENLKNINLEYNYPLLSCITYFNETKTPTIITNINMNKYMYKKFDNEKSIFFSFPKKNKQITFDGKYFHGSTILNEEYNIYEDRYILAINLWDKKPNNIDYFMPDNKAEEMYNNNITLLDINESEEEIKPILVDNKILNYKLFENILYKKQKNVFFFLKDLVSSELDKFNNFKLYCDENEEKNKQTLELKNKYGDIINDFIELQDEKNIIKYNRFLQRFLYTDIYCPSICNWIISQCENYATNNGGWTKKRHNKYPTTDLPIESIPHVFTFVLESFNTISKKIRNSYNLHEDMKLNIIDLFVVKYKYDEQNHLEMHCDGSFISFNILLNSTSDFEGGGTYFDDGLIMKQEQGQIIIHSSKIKHAGLPITKGLRYLLVGFINIELIV